MQACRYSFLKGQKKQGRSHCYQQIRKPLTASHGSNTRTRAKPGEDVLACYGSWRRLGRAPVKQRTWGRLGRAPMRQRGEGSGAPRPQRCGSTGKARTRSSGRLGAAAGKARARSGEAARGRLWGSSSSKVRQRGEGSGVLQWSPRGGGAAGSDRSGGEERRRHGGDREEEEGEGRSL